MLELNTAILGIAFCTLFQLFVLAFIAVLPRAPRTLSSPFFTHEQPHASLALLELFV